MVGLNFQLRRVSVSGPLCHTFASESHSPRGRVTSRASAARVPSSHHGSIIVHRLYSGVLTRSAKLPDGPGAERVVGLAGPPGVPGRVRAAGADSVCTFGRCTTGPF